MAHKLILIRDFVVASILELSCTFSCIPVLRVAAPKTPSIMKSFLNNQVNEFAKTNRPFTFCEEKSKMITWIKGLMTMKMLGYAIFSAIFAIFALPAYAVKIINLDSEVRKVTVIDGGERKEISIDAGGIYDTPGPNVVIENPGQQPLRARELDEYSIEKGYMTIKRRRSKPGIH